MKKKTKSYLWGHGAEILCAWVLRAKGYRILKRRCKTPLGEIDLVARRGKIIVFVEVKARPTIGEGLEANGSFQRKRTERAALFFMNSPKLTNLDMRFDMMVARPWRLPYHLPDAWRPQL